ncbi:MAG: ATP-binding cassette domain-containing protein [Sphingobium sp.]|nr:ATP-binding cassette domain-containing protein [Sphingobium sp.]MBP6112679.1 ATP-binding cassette domain-containing protein [Sphingobium sp.]MBP8671811.1 ATP-binding cassette domain-containing protein [Sphingobium sp.]MBP9158439.1 ATP-binding cassette domain-containing protein [Sphingobium sp.]
MAKNPTPAQEAAPQRGQIGALLPMIEQVRRHPLLLTAALLSLVIASAATLAIPSGFKLVIDKGFGSGGTQDIARWFEYLMLIVVMLALASAARFYFFSLLGERVIADIRIAVQRHLLRQSPSFFEENRPSEIAARMTADATVIELIVGSTISVALRNLLTGIGGIGYLFTIAPKLTAYLLIGIPVVVLPIIVLGRRLRALSRDSQDGVASVGSMTAEILGAMRIVQAFGQEDREAQRFADQVGRTLAIARRRITMRATITAVAFFLIFGSIVAVMWQGALDVATGAMTGGSIAAFVITGGLVAGAFGSLSESWGDLLRGAGAAGRLHDLLASEPHLASPARPTPIPREGGIRIAFEQVCFRYPTRPERLALREFTLAVRPGETLALVGPSGAGKSTVLQLLLRFYDPESGAVRFNEVALKDAALADLRSNMALVPQETMIFAASARDNLRYGRWDASDTEIWEAARAANAEEFLRELPHGLDTYLGDNGARLSGGQRQRIAIARAMLRDAPILLLDEATSALDSRSEHLVQKAVERLMQGRTTIMIAHRLSTVRAADRIIVMDQGTIAEQGTHDQLIQQGGLYARLASAQTMDSDIIGEASVAEQPGDGAGATEAQAGATS